MILILYGKMQKSFLSDRLLESIYLLLVLSMPSSLEADQNPNFFWTPQAFISEHGELPESEFVKIWEKYPVYLKFDLYCMVCDVDSPINNKVRRKIEGIEDREPNNSVRVAERVKSSLLDQLPRDREKFLRAIERYDKASNAEIVNSEERAQLFHLALCYYAPIGEAIDEFTSMFGSGVTDSDGNMSYIFKTNYGLLKFTFFLNRGLVSRISFSFQSE